MFLNRKKTYDFTTNTYYYINTLGESVAIIKIAYISKKRGERMKFIPFSELHKHEYTINITEFYCYGENNDPYDCTENGMPVNLFLFCADLESTHIFADQTYNFKKNDFVYFPIGGKSISFFTSSGNPKSEIRALDIKFTLEDSDGEPFILSEDVFVISELTGKNYKNQLFEIVYMLSSNESPMFIKAKFYELLTDLSKSLNDSNKSAEYRQIINGVKFIEENFNKKISIREAADVCFISESYFRKLFKKYYKMSPLKYIHNLRLKKADELLKSGLFSMSEIAEAIGIDNPSYFSWFYKKHTAEIPSRISHKHKKNKISDKKDE